MRLERRFLWFLTAWSAVSLLNAALNGYAGELPSLPYRGTALGLLLLLGSVARWREPVAKFATGVPCQGRIAGPVYVALFTAIAMPGVAWRILAPLDASGLTSLHRGASIAFVFGVLTLIAVRVPGTGQGRRGAAVGSPPEPRCEGLQPGLAVAAWSLFQRDAGPLTARLRGRRSNTRMSPSSR